MSTDTQTTPLDRDQVEAQIRAWFAAGLPEGRIMFSPNDALLVYIKMPDPNGVAVWAVALDQQIVPGYTALITTRCEPTALPGWSLEVLCDEPVIRPDQMIAVLEVSR